MKPDVSVYSGAREEAGASALHRIDHEAAVEQVIALFAARLGDEHAAVAGGAMKWAITMCLVRRVVGANGVIGAQRG